MFVQVLGRNWNRPPAPLLGLTALGVNRLSWLAMHTNVLASEVEAPRAWKAAAIPSGSACATGGGAVVVVVSGGRVVGGSVVVVVVGIVVVVICT
jgi:hypothetical protein